MKNLTGHGHTEIANPKVPTLHSDLNAHPPKFSTLQYKRIKALTSSIFSTITPALGASYID
uniref:Uncharacterized protein n=1 Tax=Anguilla anguilla TaxID=7936 RepID=A0A0E9V525_ANGAN